MPPLRQLAAALLWSTCAGGSAPPLHLLVAPTGGTDASTPSSAGQQPPPVLRVLPTLAEAQRQLRAALAQGSRDAIIELLPGSHRVPRGGLLVTAEDSPSDGHTVEWRGSSGSALSGGEPVTGWSKIEGDPSLPGGVYAAPAPPSLPNGTARHLYVDGVRAARTRVNTR